MCTYPLIYSDEICLPYWLLIMSVHFKSWKLSQHFVWVQSGTQIWLGTPMIQVMSIRFVEFSNGGYKIRKVFAYESTYSKEFVEFWELDYWGPRKFSKTRVLKVNYFHLLRKNYLKLKLWLYFSAILLKTLKVYVNFQKKNLNKWALNHVVWYEKHFSHWNTTKNSLFIG